MNYTKAIREYCLQNSGMVLDMSYELKKHFTMVLYCTFCKIFSNVNRQS